MNIRLRRDYPHMNDGDLLCAWPDTDDGDEIVAGAHENAPWPPMAQPTVQQQLDNLLIAFTLTHPQRASVIHMSRDMLTRLKYEVTGAPWFEPAWPDQPHYKGIEIVEVFGIGIIEVH